MTGEKLEHKEITPNVVLRSMIVEFIESHPEALQSVQTARVSSQR